MSHVQPVAARVGGEASPVAISSLSDRRPRSETVGRPLAVVSSVPESGVSVPEQTGGDQLAELRAMVQAYQAALVAAGIALPTLPGGGATTTSAVGRAKGRAPMTVGSELEADPAPTGGAGMVRLPSQQPEPRNCGQSTLPQGGWAKLVTTGPKPRKCYPRRARSGLQNPQRTCMGHSSRLQRVRKNPGMGMVGGLGMGGLST